MSDAKSWIARRWKWVLVPVCLVLIAATVAGPLYRGMIIDLPYEALRSVSPDGRYAAVALTVRHHTFPLPGPEPARTKSYDHTLKVQDGAVTVFTSQTTELGTTRGLTNLFDIAWAPDSASFAYRQGRSLFLVTPGTRVMNMLWSPPAGVYIASFRWTDQNTLVILTKLVIGHSYASHGYPGWIDDSTDAQIWQVDVTAGSVSMIVTIPRAKQLFLARSSDFMIDEMSAIVPMVAVYDGSDIVVYDYQQEKEIVRSALKGPVQGIWWDGSGRVVVGVGDLYSAECNFHMVLLPAGNVVDVTASLKPLWTRRFDRMDWFKSALP